MVGENSWENGKIDQLADGLSDVYRKIIPWFKESEEEKKVYI